MTATNTLLTFITANVRIEVTTNDWDLKRPGPLVVLLNILITPIKEFLLVAPGCSLPVSLTPHNFSLVQLGR